MSKVVYTPKDYRYQVQRSEYDGSWRVREAFRTFEDACDEADAYASLFPDYPWRVVDTEVD